jgi:diguanylate cyclase (GGDEF)-like protein
LSEKSLLRKVEHLLHIQRLASEGTQLRYQIADMEYFENEFEKAGLEKYSQVLAQMLGERYRAQEVFWLEKGVLDSLRKSAENGSSTFTTGALEQLAAMNPWRDTPEEELEESLQKILLELPEGWRLKGDLQLFRVGRDREMEVGFVPVVDVVDKEVKGHFCVMEPKDWNVANHRYPKMARMVSRKMMASISFFEAKRLSYVDDVTNLYNQRYLFMVLDKEIQRAQRSGEPFTILFIDIDHFKRVNDSNGHLVGSKLLIQLGKVLQRNIRAIDYGFRYGGDEYLLLIVGVDAAQGREVGERIRKEVQDTIFDIDGVKVKLTISVGVASYPQHSRTKEDIVRLADEAMYCGKNKSRNIVYVAS